jgi:uncharacterized protein YuzE
MERPKVFISYAWTNDNYGSEIIFIAEKLMADGIETIIDKWDLTAGQDKFKFMEKMVNDASISHVLLMLNKEYQEKADNRSGGVGTEAQIISKDVYDKIEQIKFIPIIMERDENGNEYAPTFLKNRIYIDFSKKEIFSNEYEKLIRVIYKRPQIKRPSLGNPPEYLFEENSNNNDLKESENELIIELDRNGKLIKIKIKHYLDKLNEKLDDCRLRNLDENENIFGKKLYDKFLEMQIYRDSFLHVVKYFIINGNIEYYKDFYNFYHNIENYYQPKKGTYDRWNSNEYDNFSLFFYELIISNIAMLMHYDSMELLKVSLNFTFIDDIKYDFYFEPIDKRLSTIYNKFGKFHTIGWYYNSITGKNYLNPLAEMIKSRIYSEISLSELIEADLLLHYFRLDAKEYEQYYPLFAEYTSLSKYEFFSKLVYKDNFDKLINLFNKKTRQELIDFFNNGNFSYENAKYYRGKVPRLTDIVGEQLLGKM